jgi:hypothetical protein
MSPNGAACFRVDGTYRAGFTTDRVQTMQEARTLSVARITAEMSAAADLNGVFRWLVERHGSSMRVDVNEMPALGQHSWLRLALPITAPRAVLCTLWLVDDVVAGKCLLAGHLRVIAHPTGSDIRLSFSGRTAAAMRYGAALHRQADQVGRQLLEVIGRSIERPSILPFPANTSQSAAIN